MAKLESLACLAWLECPSTSAGYQECPLTYSELAAWRVSLFNDFVIITVYLHPMSSSKMLQADAPWSAEMPSSFTLQGVRNFAVMKVKGVCIHDSSVTATAMDSRPYLQELHLVLKSQVNFLQVGEEICWPVLGLMKTTIHGEAIASTVKYMDDRVSCGSLDGASGLEGSDSEGRKRHRRSSSPSW